MAAIKENKRSKSKQPKDSRARRHSEKFATKTADSKGRVVLGGQYANRPVILQMLSDTEIIIKMARVIPESDAWLYENPKALAAVRKGLAQARAGKVSRTPVIDADAKFASELQD